MAFKLKILDVISVGFPFASETDKISISIFYGHWIETQPSFKAYKRIKITIIYI